ncbi:hypothetical protein ONS95_004717 [Cadophora gregata]|uniref:uncharacterized protein n=1 Tax=Cadophora gregata TaxID=51156 RepID=UPI0026DB5FCB|nr:uncharacterized protein ONS95_004717 [Cadophora gregata]KAK0104424.1 hypothetical protein ONS95_004717 [Cadophora gregata]
MLTWSPVRFQHADLLSLALMTSLGMKESKAPHLISDEAIPMYEHLKNNEIRLLEVKPAFNDEEEMVCRLRTVFRDAAPNYKALSYCWGPPEERGKRSIVLEIASQRIRWPVTPTLEMALRRLRNTDGSTSLLIWADAVCINQEDEVEKGQQVQEMRHVYQNAVEVAIWLGPADQDSVLAWKLMNDLFSSDLEKFPQEPRRLAQFNEAQFRAFQNLFRRDYFWRIWIVQEIACARKATVYCGADSMPWSRLLFLSETLDKVLARARDEGYEDDSAIVFLMMRGGPGILKATTTSIVSFSAVHAQPLLDLLCSHMIKGSTDPRDKVHGLVGISADWADFGKISYERSTRALFLHTAQYIISTTQKLNVICIKQNDDNPHNLPSWVADWERRNIFPKFGVKQLYIRQPPFAASRNVKALFNFTKDREVLNARGFIVDTIATVAQPFHDNWLGPGTPVPRSIRASHGLRAFHGWWSVFTDKIGKERYEVFQRAFCGGAWAPPESEFEQDLSLRLAFFFGMIRKCLPELQMDNDLLLMFPDLKIESQVLEARQYALVFSASRRMHGKRFVVSSAKLAGLAPQAAREGDKIVVLFGCDFPVVMRNMGTYWLLIGEIYVDGIMYGEAMDDLASGS